MELRADPVRRRNGVAVALCLVSSVCLGLIVQAGEDNGLQPPAPKISIAELPLRGLSEAPVTIVAFLDYQCPQSLLYYREIWPKIDEEYVQTGRVRYVVKNFPDLNHSNQGLKVHEAAACAADQGKFWEMHTLLFGNQSTLAPEDLVAHAGTLGLDVDLFRYCLTSSTHAERISRDIEEGRRGGITVTPVFVIGPTDPGESSIRVRQVIAGRQPYAAFEKAIHSILEIAESDP